MMIMPSSIWHDVVLPEVDGIRGLSHSASNSPTSRNYTIQLDALRPVLDCQVVPDERMKISGTKYPDTFRIYASPKLPTSCQRGGQNGTDDHVNYQLGFQTDQLWAGQLLDLHLGPWPEDVKSQVTLDLASQGEWLSGNYSTMPDNPAGCPSIGLIFAKVSANKTSLDDITALLCSQKIQLVKVKVTYKGDLSAKAIINPDIPPVLLDNPVKYITNGTPGFESFPWRVQTYLSANIGKNLTAFNVDGEMQHDDGSSSTESSVDIFFNNVIYGPNGTAPEDLAGVENRGNLIKAVQTLYNRYMSIVIDVKFRQPISQAAIGDQSNTVNGTMQIQTSRLKVNNASKLALQIMLGVMTLLGLGAYWLTDLRGTLPRNPCSIASSMGFLAGSELCDGSNALIPEDAIEMSEEEQKSLFDGVLLSLGWWADRKDESRGMLDGSHEGSTQSLLDDGDVPRDRIFGVDVGTPEQLGFRETRWWKLRRRMARSDA
ncbi:hypothetical protein DOTSEDRAFT_74852 [Dothistroma septosporum NZE10]|uniref:Uncharacterized protein n=1 Tax=Dothistroma septosporum (strain NZE10 / CBS 128990) TaxID=675120 RepID=N1PFU0_DOTSN|nr:hypothetical protein DOTSEDRAFT_74852 [Dothistroma septosporum NZE10]